MKKLSEIKRQEQIDILEDKGIDDSSFFNVDSNKIHKSMWLCSNVFTDGELVVFINASQKERNTFIYYVGGENDSELIYLNEGIAIYENLAHRVDRFTDRPDEEDDDENYSVHGHSNDV